MTSNEDKSEDYCEEYEEQTEEPEDPNEETIKSELSEMPFEELLKLRDNLGTKVFNEMIATKMDSNIAKSYDKKRIKSFGRVNKNRPQEMSSKAPVNQLREVFHVKKNRDHERRDPRFDEQCGQYSQNVFTKTYGFLNDIKDKEMNELKKMLKKTKNETKRQELNYLLQRMKNQRMSQQLIQKRKDIETNARNKLNEEMKNKNNFVNKSTLKRLELVEKFKHLKKSGKMAKYLEKKRKRNAMRERKRLPAKKERDVI